MKYILKCFFSLFLVLCSLTTLAQKAAINDSTALKKDSVKPKTERYGLRVGVDMYKFTRSLYDKNYKGLELVGDFKFTRRHYLAAEIGNENITVADDQLNFTTNGTYLKVGFDYNSYENWLGMNNMIYVGMRYGVSAFNQTLNSYSIYYANNYFPKPNIESGEKFDGLSAQWLEVVAGVKAELIRNLYLGFSFRMNHLISNKTPENFDNLYIPGFNRTYEGKFGAGFNYSVSYFLPLYKKTLKNKSKEVTPKK
ncbi:MAG: hypothetical protein RIQ59_851 [Bacteroidota bacterium]